MRYRIEFKVLDSSDERTNLNGYWSGKLQCVEVDAAGLIYSRLGYRMELPAAQAVWDAFDAMPNIEVLSTRPE